MPNFRVLSSLSSKHKLGSIWIGQNSIFQQTTPPTRHNACFTQTRDFDFPILSSNHKGRGQSDDSPVVPPCGRSGARSSVRRVCANQEKKTPFCSRPTTETRFALESGGESDWNLNPGCSADQVIVAPVLKKVPLKCCELFSICAAARAPSHSTSKETFARTGKIPGIGGVGRPSPCVSELTTS